MLGSRRVKAALALLTGCALLAGCGRFPYEYRQEPRRSIKDDVVAERTVRERPPAAVPAAAPRRPRVRTKPAKKVEARVVQPAAPPARLEPPPAPSRPVAADPAPRTAPPPLPAPASPPPAPAASVATDRPVPTATPVAPSPRRPTDGLDTAAAQRLLAEGRSLFAEGKVVEARKRFTEASPGADAMLALARTFDTHYLSQLAVSDGAPDMQRALTLYTRALERGASEAGPDLERVKATLSRPKTD